MRATRRSQQRVQRKWEHGRVTTEGRPVSGSVGGGRAQSTQAVGGDGGAAETEEWVGAEMMRGGGGGRWVRRGGTEGGVKGVRLQASREGRKSSAMSLKS